MAEDWRLSLASPPEFYARFTWMHKPWTKTREGWDHDHCEFCRAKISDAVVEGGLAQGWASDNDYYWVCDPCFTEFRETFKWNEVPR
jgi:hypothetical protein